MVIMLGSIAAYVEVDNFVDESLHQPAIRGSAFTLARWWVYGRFVAFHLDRVVCLGMKEGFQY
jgi:methane/ammonia monooxygenase subunit C